MDEELYTLLARVVLVTTEIKAIKKSPMCRNAGNGENGEYGKKLREGWRYKRVPFKSGDFGKKIFR